VDRTTLVAVKAALRNLRNLWMVVSGSQLDTLFGFS
jgi:hypothetical protein